MCMYTFHAERETFLLFLDFPLSCWYQWSSLPIIFSLPGILTPTSFLLHFPLFPLHVRLCGADDDDTCLSVSWGSFFPPCFPSGEILLPCSRYYLLPFLIFFSCFLAQETGENIVFFVCSFTCFPQSCYRWLFPSFLCWGEWELPVTNSSNMYPLWPKEYVSSMDGRMKRYSCPREKLSDRSLSLSLSYEKRNTLWECNHEVIITISLHPSISLQERTMHCMSDDVGVWSGKTRRMNFVLCYCYSPC